MFKYIYIYGSKIFIWASQTHPIITLLQENRKQALIFPIINNFDQLKYAVFADNMPLVFDLYWHLLVWMKHCVK